MTTIVQKENPILRKKSHDVPIKDIHLPKIQKIIKTMERELEVQADGVAIAAPQIGESLRIFVVSKRIFEMEAAPSHDAENPELRMEKNLVFINPEIVRKSRQARLLEEGCLSIRWLYGKVKRSTKATVRAYDETGKKFERGAKGLMAQVFQHEIDHLNGILFTDKATDVREMPPPA